MIGVLMAFALILGFAGLTKIATPDLTVEAIRALKLRPMSVLARRSVVRILGLGELLIAAATLTIGGRTCAALLGVAYAVLAFIAWRLVKDAPGQDCGCFGKSDEPISHWHTAINIAGAATGAASAVWLQQSAPDVLTSSHAIPIAALTIALAWLGYIAMTALPELGMLRKRLESAS